MKHLKEIMTPGITSTKYKVYPKFSVKNEKKERDAFITDLRFAGTRMARQLGKHFTFQIDDENIEVVNQLWYYITESEKFNGDPQKGLCLTGGIGTGKTIMMFAFLEVMRMQTGKVYMVTYPDTIHKDLQTRGLEWFRKRPLFIDDLTREPEKVAGYWGENPVRLITMLRNRQPCQNYATCNLRILGKDGKVMFKNGIIERYGAMIFDRMREAYNFLELTGKTRR